MNKIVLILVIAILIGLNFSLIQKKYLVNLREYTFAKVLNFIVFVIMLFSNLNKISYNSGWLKNNFSSAFEQLYVSIGHLPPIVVFLSWFIYFFICIYAVVIVWGILKFKSSSRAIFLKLIPFLWLFEVIHIYKVLFLNSTNISQSISAFYIGAILNTFFWILIFVIYNSNMMKTLYLISSDDHPSDSSEVV
jgi:hypothetical protein